MRKGVWLFHTEVDGAVALPVQSAIRPPGRGRSAGADGRHARFATPPLPLLVIAQMLGMPYTGSSSSCASCLNSSIFIGRGEPDRMRLTREAIHGLVEYLAPH